MTISEAKKLLTCLLDTEPVLTGSRAIGGSTDTSDIDFLCGVDDLAAAVQTLDKAGFTTRQVSLLNAAGHDWLSLKLGNIDAIVTLRNGYFYRHFLGATRLAADFGLTRKGDRIKLFQAIIYDNFDGTGITAGGL